MNSGCRITCPPEFKYVQDGGQQKCVSTTDNRYYLPIQNIPQGASATSFTDEQARFLTNFIELMKTISTEQLRAAAALAEPGTSIQAHDGVSQAYAETIEILTPLRPPTQPVADIESTKLSIASFTALDLRTLQICLIFIIFAILEYFILPSSIVHGVAFLTLCVGFAAAIYLSNK